jgi:hypothetical protein
MDTCRNHFIQVHGESYREKDILCLVCKELFAFQKNLSNHMKKIHNISDRIEIVKGYDGLLAKSASGKGVCLVCCKVFTRMDTCKNHFKLHQNQSSNISGIVKQVSYQYNHENAIHQYSNNGSLLDNIYEESATAVKHERDYNDNIYSNVEEFAGNPNYSEDETFSPINPNDKYMSSDKNVENQVDSAGDLSTMLEVKSECIDQGNQKTIMEAVSIKAEINEKSPPVNKRLNLKKEKPLRPKSSKKLPRKSEITAGISGQYGASNAVMKVTKMESGQALCEVCGKSYSRITKAKDHYLKSHGEDDDMKNYFCQICKEGYVFEQNLNAHMKSVHGILERTHYGTPALSLA